MARSRRVHSRGPVTEQLLRQETSLVPVLEIHMTEKITPGAISRRRALSVIGIAALSIAVPSTVLTVSNVQAKQAPSPPAQTPTTTKQTGTERPQERRT